MPSSHADHDEATTAIPINPTFAQIRALLTGVTAIAAVQLQDLARLHGMSDYGTDADPISGPGQPAAFDEARYTLFEAFWQEMIPTAHARVLALLDTRDPPDPAPGSTARNVS